jgi:stage II sporulation protein AA (anti-sigma F factor antagonist)
MATTYELIGNTLWVHLEGELDHHLAKQVKKKCQFMMISHPVENIGFDFLKTDFMDSSGVGMIMGRFQEVQAVGGKIYTKNINRNIDRIMTLSGLYKVIGQ